MKKKIFTGSGVAIITPFTEDGINFNRLKKLINYQISEGTDAIIICGTTGESATMTNEEHIAAIKTAVEAAAGRVPVIAGTGVNDTMHSVLLTQAAEEAGADAALTVTPYYNKTSQAGLYEHFKTIAENTSLPIVLYNVPSRTGLNITPETYEKLCKIPNINAVKECKMCIRDRRRHMPTRRAWAMPLPAAAFPGTRFLSPQKFGSAMPDMKRRLPLLTSP